MNEYLTKNARTISLPANKVYDSLTGDSVTSTISLSTPVDEDGSILEHLIPSPEEDEPEDTSGLRTAIMKLKPIHQLVLTKYYGLGDTESKTLQEIGDEIGVSKEAIRQHIKNAESKLKVLLNDKTETK